jgi:phenylpropionate dioxygenase-like ring-hydroxylating dioxygenase large terminal subunit
MSTTGAPGMLVPRELIRPDRVHRKVYVDARVFELEMDRIFGRAWIFLGHDSQIPNSGDFFATRIARDPLLIVRQEDGSIRALLNRCAHKGMQICPDDTRGNARVFRCAYHGWTFKLDGTIRTIPAASGYEGSCIAGNRKEADLRSIGSLETYRGFIFGRLAPSGPSLLDWLGPMRSSVDNFVDRSPEGRIEVAGGVLRYLHDCNWKFFLENTLDALHPMVAHQSAVTAAKEVQSEFELDNRSSPFALQMMMPFGASYSFYNQMGERGAPYGHGDLGNSQSIHSGYESLGDYTALLEAAYGKEKTSQILSTCRNNSVLYPSVMMKAPVSMLRIIRPLAVDKTVLETWHFRLRGAPAELFHRTVQYSTLINSSAGPVGPDDHEAYRRLQSGLAAEGHDWVIMARYLGKETPDAEGALASAGTSDFVHRNQFAAWLNYMEAQ